MIQRRDFITLLGGAAATWPLAARAQQPTMPVIGFLGAVSPAGFSDRLQAFHQGLKDTGYAEGANVAIEYRWADNQLNRLPAMAADLVRRQVAVHCHERRHRPDHRRQGRDHHGSDRVCDPRRPCQAGPGRQPARPGGNLTGINFFFGELVPKRLELLRELVPAMTRVAVFVNPGNPARAELHAARGGNRRRAPWGCKSRSSTRAAAVRSMGLRSLRTRTAGRAVRQPRPLFHRPARAACHPGSTPCDSRVVLRRASSSMRAA